MSSSLNHNGLSEFFDFFLESSLKHLRPPGTPVENEHEAVQFLEQYALEAKEAKDEDSVDSVGKVKMTYVEAHRHYIESLHDSHPLFQPI